MKKLSLMIFIGIFIFSLNTSAYAEGKKTLLKDKMEAKGKTAGTSKVLAQYQDKFKKLMGEIEYQYIVLDGMVKQSQNLSEDDKAALLDLLENDPDYSLSNVKSTYNDVISQLPKNDVKAMTKTLESLYKSFNDVFNNLKDYAVELPQYYIYGDDQTISNVDDNNNDIDESSASSEVKSINDTDKNEAAKIGTNKDNTSDNVIKITTEKPLNVDQIKYIFNKMKPGDTVIINGEKVGYDTMKAQLSKMVSQAQNSNQKEHSTIQNTTTPQAVDTSFITRYEHGILRVSTKKPLTKDQFIYIFNKITPTDTIYINDKQVTYEDLKELLVNTTNETSNDSKKETTSSAIQLINK